MCGIAGIVAPDLGRRGLEEFAARAARTLAHRGPDDSGVWSDPSAGVALAQTRLAILDLSPAGHNPMPWREGRYWITFNGEVYNFEELRVQLEGVGCPFRSRTDTEVVLAAYERWGPSCVERFVGMFAFAIWDVQAKSLFLARDRLGKKPLYYARYGGRFVFGSELKAILADPEFPREVEPDALSLYLRFGSVPAPHSIFRQAWKLPPGHRALLDESGLRVERYWDPLPLALEERVPMEEGEATSRLETLLSDAVRLRMISDVPLGAFLSGGIDSSLVTALMQEQSKQKVRTFSIRFEDSEYNEADHAAAVARHLGTEHREATCSRAEMLAEVERLPDLLDEPFADSSLVPTLLVSRITRRDVTVALSGDGGDELFFGYPRYHALAQSAWLLRAPASVRRGAAAVAGLFSGRRFQRAAAVLQQGDGDVFMRFAGIWPAEDVEAMTGHPVARYGTYDGIRSRTAALPPHEQAPLLDLGTYLPEDILTKLDRASMAVSLETRCPLLDHRIVELAMQLELPLKWRDGIGKRILRTLLYRRVPRELVDRPKMGFGVPLAEWFRGPLRQRMQEELAGEELARLGLDPSPARGRWREFVSGRPARTELLWNAFALICWSRRWRSGASAEKLGWKGS